MKAGIEQRLQPLIGEPLSSMYRYAEHQAFPFGVQHPCKNDKGEDATHADWGFMLTGDDPKPLVMTPEGMR